MDSRKKDEYTFGQCKFCLKQAALKNGLCLECQLIEEKNNPLLPEGFEDIFRQLGNNKKNEKR